MISLVTYLSVHPSEDPDTEEQFNPEDYPIAGKIDSDLVHWNNSGLIVNYCLETGEGV